MTRCMSLLLATLPSSALAYGLVSPMPGELCHAAIASAERQWRIPDRLLDSIGVVESGHRDGSGVASPWPWTINAEGVGQWFQSKAEAIAAVENLRARGVQSIDVGCLQVNLMYHPEAFTSLDQAFDPAANASYAARFLTELYGQTGTWRQAAAGYHSLTPDIGEDYARKVMAIWQHAPEATSGTMLAMARPAPTNWTGGGRLVLPGTSVMLYGSGGGHIISLANPGLASVGAGRSLASYRATPTTLAFAAPR